MFDKILIANRGEIALEILRRPRSSASRPWRSIQPPIRTRCTSSWPMRAYASGRRRRATAISTFPRLSLRARSPALTRFIQATVSRRERAFRGYSRGARDHIIGPKAEHIRLMGDKIEAKRTAKRLGSRVSRDLRAAYEMKSKRARSPTEIGYPVIVKASAGGGGRGMKVASDPTNCRGDQHGQDRGEDRVRR